MTKYVCVCWPEYQIFMAYPRFSEECYYCPDNDVYFIPEDLYEEVLGAPKYPYYAETNLGTIIFHEFHAIVNNSDYYWYDENNVKRGDIALVYNDEDKKYYTSKIVSCSKGFPILLEDSNLLIGINCTFVGHTDA